MPGMYDEQRVRVSDYRVLSIGSPLLVDVPGTGGRPRKLHHAAAMALGRISDAVLRDLGIELLVSSGHRRHRWKSWDDYAAAMRRKYGSVARGRQFMAFDSPHETGLAIDIGSGGLRASSSTAEQQRGTPLHRWLVEHAHEFGWHPYKREPWHWEYPIARELFEVLP